jgi:hypothetical protein
MIERSTAGSLHSTTNRTDPEPPGKGPGEARIMSIGGWPSHHSRAVAPQDNMLAPRAPADRTAAALVLSQLEKLYGGGSATGVTLPSWVTSTTIPGANSPPAKSKPMLLTQALPRPSTTMSFQGFVDTEARSAYGTSDPSGSRSSNWRSVDPAAAQPALRQEMPAPPVWSSASRTASPAPQGTRCTAARRASAPPAAGRTPHRTCRPAPLLLICSGPGQIYVQATQTDHAGNIGISNTVSRNYA